MSPKKIKLKLFKNFLKLIAVTPFVLFFINANNPNLLKASVEFQWDKSQNFKKLRWYQKSNRKSARNKIFLFLRKSDRKTGLLKLNLKVPDRFTSQIKEEKISLCKVQVGGFSNKTKCLKNIPVEIEIDNKNNSVDIYPTSPLPADDGNYAIVLKVTNPNRGGLYQFHSFGQSSGNIPVSFYLGSWTIDLQSL